MTPGLLLGWLGGGQPDVLREAPGDAARFSSMGAVLLGTAGMAALSATFALTTAVNLPVAAATAAGVLWGLLILGLDRMLVISMSQQQGLWPTLATALPRLGLALLIGTVISVPLVLRIFEPELNNELQVIHSENLVANQKKLDERFADIAAKQARIDALQPVANGQAGPLVSTDPDVVAARAAADRAQTAYDKAAASAQCELTGKCGSGEAGPGDAFRSARAQADRALKTLNDAQARLREVTAAATARISGGAANAQRAAAGQLQTLVPELAQRQADRRKAQADLDRGEEGNTGLLVRLEALGRLSDGNATMWLAHLALMALFACIELLPVLAKLLSGRSDSLYQRIVKAREGAALGREDAALALQAERLADEERLLQLSREAREELEADRLARQTESGKRANTLLAAKQEDIARRAIEVWGEVAARRTDEELERWYEQHQRSAGGPGHQQPVPAQYANSPAAATTQFPLNGQQPAAVSHPTAPAVGP